ncbi:zonular occludens toxin [Pectobacterium carotovorum]|uniref:zonular occludens toxin family protein n=1 Tax=Pectobacterium carotovorum TaxID=554 RepID=UPI0010FD8EA3|nr:zonular occludens toxin domain-containing protein [Pectobacterium carotovorum]KAA3668306.1 zonular occludens toxin [Pectobacterium carotovorum subsp. carotovorum]UCZ77638.1 zonular occludens toxin [Pectobacterium carotovorum]
MAISAYIGVPGSGKSFEVVRSVIIPAVAQGRRVVSNIYGLNPEKVYEFVRRNNKTENMGEVVFVTNEQAQDDYFFPYKNAVTDGKETFCRAGDLICIDEAWRIWGSDAAVPKNHRSFIAEHRHFSHPETGITCDLVVINQSIANLPRFIRDRTETSYRMTKLKSLGLSSMYRVEIFGGAKLTKTERISVKNYRYDKRIFPLYQSYDGNGSEQIVDRRQSIFSNFTLLATIAVLIILVSAGGWYLWGFFHPEDKKTSVHQNQPAGTIGQPPKNPAVPAPAPIAAPKISTQWRVSGVIQDKNGRFIVLSGADGRQRVEPAAGFVVSGAIISGVLDGEIVTSWSGSSAK